MRETIGRRVKLLSTVALFLLLPCVAPATDERLLGEEEAREEVRIVVQNVLHHHPDPFHVTPKKAFYREVDELLSREGRITAARQFFDLSRLLSLVFDTHTQLHVTEETPAFRSTFPLRFRIFSDGLHIIAGSEPYRDAVGTRGG